jgi:hypothetical protein
LCLTIASACNLVFGKTFLEEGTIAIIPPCGYNPENKQSIIALKMLVWIAQRDNVAMEHARNCGEKWIGKYLVDGFNEEANVVWEIHGCLWHGCERCYARDTVNPVNHLTMHDLRQRTLEKAQYLCNNGFNVTEIWTCDIDGDWEPPTGSYLGDFTDELDGAHITTFASGGPKNYSYETSKGKTVCKVRGITLNYRTRQFINHKVVCEMVFLNAFSNENDTITIDIPHKIVRDTKEKDIITKSETQRAIIDKPMH